MKIYNKTLKKGHKLLRTGHYGNVISLLEPKVPLFLENYNFYYFLGAACYLTGDMGGAETYLKRAVQVNRKAEDPRLFLAAVYLKKKDTTEAVRIWLGLLDLNPSNRKAKKGLNKIRKIEDQDVLNVYLDSGNFSSILPRTANRIPKWVNVALILILMIGTLYLSSSFWIPLFNQVKQPSRGNLDRLYQNLDSSFLSPEPSEEDVIFILSEGEIRDSLKKAQFLFDEYKDNEARVEINRLKRSNASEEVKKKAMMLEGFLKEPDITSITGSYTYKDIRENQALYENCFILWRGRFTNLRYNEDNILFDFLIGYDKSQVLEGIITVSVSFPVNLDPSYPLELLGQVKIQEDKSILLQAIAVHNIIE